MHLDATPVAPSQDDLYPLHFSKGRKQRSAGREGCVPPTVRRRPVGQLIVFAAARMTFMVAPGCEIIGTCDDATVKIFAFAR
ncbi:MAG: hypothetical protein QOH15_98 [Gaiellales bacterium]|nr:hypothetical protein [Gaiellales bacterium]